MIDLPGFDELFEHLTRLRNGWTREILLRIGLACIAISLGLSQYERYSPGLNPCDGPDCYDYDPVAIPTPRDTDLIISLNMWVAPQDKIETRLLNPDIFPDKVHAQT